MAICKTITISSCPDDSTCEACKEMIKSQCIKYTGVDLDTLGIDTGDTLNQILIDINTVIDELSGNTSTDCPCIPQACVKLKKIGEGSHTTGGEIPVAIVLNLMEFFSCSAPTECIKSYNIKDSSYEILIEGTLEECTSFAISELSLDTVYSITEIITCAGGTTESTECYFRTLTSDDDGVVILYPKVN